MKKIITNFFIIMFIAFTILMLNNNKTMAKYVIKSKVEVNTDILIDINSPTIKIIDSDNNIISDNSEANSDVILKEVSDDLSGIKQITYKYNADSNNLDLINSEQITIGTVFKDDGYYEIEAIDNAKNVTTIHFSIKRSNISVDYENAFITEWTITSNNTTITLPITVAPNILIDWGDGIIEEINKISPMHTYINSGSYDISISGNLPEWNFKSINTSKDNITGIKKWGKVNFKNMQTAFYKCIKLTGAIPEPDNESFKDVTSFNATFYGCNNLTGNIPDNLFFNCTNVTSFEGTFNGCSKLVGSIPENLFRDCQNVISFSNTFNSCGGLTGNIPARLFSNCPKVTNFGSTFYACGKLTGNIPAGLFSNCPNVTTFFGTFRDCYKLSGTIPANLFANCTKVTNFSNIFYDCSKLTGSIPGNLFANCPKVTDFSTAFYYCTSLTGDIPENLFANCPDAYSFSRTFGSCRQITGIPENLFANCPKAMKFTNTFTSTFSGCSSVTSVVINIDKIDNDMFNNCEKLINITIGNNVKSIGNNAFYLKKALNTNITTDNQIAKDYNWSNDNRIVTIINPASSNVVNNINNNEIQQEKQTIFNKEENIDNKIDNEETIEDKEKYCE